MNRFLRIIAIGVLAVWAFASCMKDNFELKEKFSKDIEWNPSLALPIAEADMTLANLAKERQDTLEHISEKTLGYGTNDDDKVIQFRYMIDTARTVDVMHLPILKPYDTTVRLQPIKIDNVSFPIGYVSIDDLIKDNFSSADYQEYVDEVSTHPGAINVGGKTAVTEHLYPIGEIPDWAKTEAEKYFGKEVNVKDIFEYIVLQSGSITMTTLNNSDIAFYCDLVISSKNDKGEFVDFAIFNYKSGYPGWIPKNSSLGIQTFEVDSGAYLNSEFYFSFRDFRIAQVDNGIVMDLKAQGVLLNLEMKNLIATEGKAYVPEQELQDEYVQYMTVHDEDMNRKLFNVLVAKGAFHYDITSSMGIATEFIAEFPSVDSAGTNPVRKYAAMTNEKPTYSDDWHLDGCNIDLTQNPDQAYNSVPIKVGYKVHTTGGMLNFSCKEDSITVQVTNTDSIYFAYLEGDMGKFDQDIFSETLDFDLKDYLGEFMSVESLVLYDPKVNITYDNPVGIAGDLELNLVGKDDKGNSVDLFGGHQNKWRVVRPSCDSARQGLAASSGIYINKSTSNIVDFVKMMPKKIDYSGIFHVNSDIPNESSILNCVSNKGKAKLGVSIELPLNLSAKNFVLQKDVDLDMSQLGDLSMVEKVRLYINTEHQLPVNSTLTISLMDTTKAGPNQLLGTLDIVVLEAAQTENGKVPRNVKKNTVEEVTLDYNDPMLEKFLQANKLRFEVFLETANGGTTPVIFYSYYGLNISVAADCKFIYSGRL